ncbi:COQ9 family protein [Altererythrobacter xixiisoli]|uniref:COQ9 family protein n=1 Tax=Croceibacterium xixiisoli TaxID=1476466 RepID=A0A6I4TY31_9SPHN|nr:COQ9 family protein [Croceibacterium xixiisoli]MXP00927.1 COQ9 family protein [Croceibacterium xixiisoli]
MNQAPTLDEMTLEELRLALAPDVASAAAFDGWTGEALEQAAAARGVDSNVARLAIPGGPMDLIDAWVESIDAAMRAAFAGDVLASTKIRERIRRLVQFRIDAVRGKEEALRRALTIQAMPQNLPRALKMGWRSADIMWRLAGDDATDYNHYSKRATLGAIYGATLAVFADDTSEGKADTAAFLDRRIEGVMRFEKAKAKWLKPREHFDVARFLGRLRYPTT